MGYILLGYIFDNRGIAERRKLETTFKILQSLQYMSACGPKSEHRSEPLAFYISSYDIFIFPYFSIHYYLFRINLTFPKLNIVSWFVNTKNLTLLSASAFFRDSQHWRLQDFCSED